MNRELEFAAAVETYFNLAFENWERICRATRDGFWDDDPYEAKTLEVVALYGERVSILHEILQGRAWYLDAARADQASRSVQALAHLERRLSMHCRGVVDIGLAPAALQ